MSLTSVLAHRPLPIIFSLLHPHVFPKVGQAQTYQTNSYLLLLPNHPHDHDIY